MESDGKRSLSRTVQGQGTKGVQFSKTSMERTPRAKADRALLPVELGDLMEKATITSRGTGRTLPPSSGVTGRFKGVQARQKQLEISLVDAMPEERTPKATARDGTDREGETLVVTPSQLAALVEAAVEARLRGGSVVNLSPTAAPNAEAMERARAKLPNRNKTGNVANSAPQSLTEKDDETGALESLEETKDLTRQVRRTRKLAQDAEVVSEGISERVRTADESYADLWEELHGGEAARMAAATAAKVKKSPVEQVLQAGRAAVAAGFGRMEVGQGTEPTMGGSSPAGGGVHLPQRSTSGQTQPFELEEARRAFEIERQEWRMQREDEERERCEAAARERLEREQSLEEEHARSWLRVSRDTWDHGRPRGRGIYGSPPPWLHGGLKRGDVINYLYGAKAIPGEAYETRYGSFWEDGKHRPGIRQGWQSQGEGSHLEPDGHRDGFRSKMGSFRASEPSRQERADERSSVDERSAEAQERLASAQESLVVAALPDVTDLKIANNPMARHPVFVIQRYILSACGFRPSGGLAKDSYQGEGYGPFLLSVLQDPNTIYPCLGLNFELLPSHYLVAVRGNLSALALGSFRDAPTSELVLSESKLAPRPLRLEPPMPPPTDRNEVRQCGDNLAIFLRKFFNEALGEAFERLNRDCARLVLHDHAFTYQDHLRVLEDALRRVDSNVAQTLADVDANAKAAGKNMPLGCTPAALRAIKDGALSLNGRGGTVMTPPEDGLDPDDLHGVLESRRTAKMLALEAEKTSFAQHELERRQAAKDKDPKWRPGARAKGRTAEHLLAGVSVQAAETEAAWRLAPKDQLGQKMCLLYLSHRGCPSGKGKRCRHGSHGQQTGATVPEVEVFLVQFGGPKARNGQPVKQVEPTHAHQELARWRQEAGKEVETKLLSAAMAGVERSSHPLEQALREDLAQKEAPLTKASLPEPVRRVTFGEPDTALMVETRAVAKVLRTAYPEIAKVDDNIQALLYRHAVGAHRKGVPLQAPDDLLLAGLPYLKRSSLPGAEEVVQWLRPPRTTARGTGTTEMLLASGARAQDSKGRPLMVIHPRDGQGHSQHHLCFECWSSQDCGQRVGNIDSQCVPLVLAHICGVAAIDLLKSGVQQAGTFLEQLGPLQDRISIEELGLRQCAHDFLHGKSHDLFLARYFFRALFESKRLVIVSVANSESPVRVQVLCSREWDGRAPGAKTHFVLAARGHAEVLMPPARYGPYEPGGAVPWASSEAILSHLSHYVEVERFDSLTVNEVMESPRSLNAKLLTACLCCGESLVLGPSQRAGRASPLLTPRLPYELQAYVGRMELVGGLTMENLKRASEDRGGDYKEWLRTTQDIKNHSFTTEVKKHAAAFVACGREGLRTLDKDAVKEHHPEAMKKLAEVLKDLAVRGDKLVQMANGSVRGAAAAVRQAELLYKGSLPLDGVRVEKLRGLVGDAQLDLLKGMAECGVPLLQTANPDLKPYEGPYSSAKASSGSLGYTAVKDVANGRSILVTGKSEKALREANAVLSRLGAVPKKDALGAVTGEARPVTDLRGLNKEIADSVALQRKKVGLEAPPAVCPRMRQLIRLAVYLARRFPGVPILGGKSDLSEAFKLVHLLVADVPSTAWALPTDGLPGLEDTFIVQIALMLAFGFDKSPGWFGVLAWVLAEAHASLGPEEPELNGWDSFGGGAPHVDDYVFLTAELGQRPQMAYKSYTELAQLAGGEGAINGPKDAIDGQPRSVLRPWGKILNLEKVPTGGPLAGQLSSPAEKVQKLREQLLVSGFEKLYLQSLTLRSLSEATGLAVWLSDTNALLKALLPSFYAALSSKDVTHVDPPGSPQEVAVVWAELSDAVELAKLQCEDAKRFASSFTSSLLRALSPREQVALGVPRAWLQSDSTGKDKVLTAEGGIVLGKDGRPACRAGIFALACFHLGVYGVDEVQRYEKLLERIVDLDRETHIVVGEMLPIICAAMEHGEQWRGMLITCAADNVAVVAAVNKWASSHPFVRYLSLLLVRLQSLHGFALWAYYINTKTNVLADQLTRLYQEKTPVELQAYVDSQFSGLERKTYTRLYEFLLNEEHAVARSFALPLDGEAGTLNLLKNAVERRGWWRAAQTQVRAYGGEDTEGVGQRKLGKFVEIYGGAGNGAAAAARLGLECAAIIEGHSPSCLFAADRQLEWGQIPEVYATIKEALESLSIVHGVDLVLVAAPPPGEAAVKEIPVLVRKLLPKLVCVELLPSRTAHEQEEAVEGWMASMHAVGYQLLGPVTGITAANGEAWEHVDVAELGGGQRRERVILHFEEDCWAHVAGPLSELQPQPGPNRGLMWALQPLDELSEDLYIPGKFCPATRPNSPTRPWLAGYLYDAGGSAVVGVGSVVRLCGHREIDKLWKVLYVAGEELQVSRMIEADDALEAGEKKVMISEVKEHIERRRDVWDLAGTSATVCSSKAEPFLVLENRGAQPRVRRLSLGEVWKLQGLTLENLRRFQEMRGKNNKRNGDRRKEERDVASRTQHAVLSAALVARAAARLEVLRSRLRLLISGDVYEVVEYLGTGETEVVRRSDGTVEETTAVSLKPYNRILEGALVTSGQFQEPTTRVAGGPNRPIGKPSIAPGPGARDELLRAATTQLVGGSIKEGTMSTYDSSFKHWSAWRAGRRKPLYLDGRNPREDEDELLTFVAHKALNADYAHSTIHVMLYALRFKHLMERKPDPLADKLLLRIAMKGISRLQGGPWRKIPASMDMLRWIVSQLDLDDNDELLVAIALVMMLLFLMRSREALRKNAQPDAKQCVRVGNVLLVGAGAVKTGKRIQEADEVMLMQGASKTDPNGQGSVANVFEAPGDELCLVGLIKRLQRQLPGHFDNPEAYFFTLSDGRVLHRDVVMSFLQEAAVAHGAPKGAVSVISLRSGGASAMWDKGFTAEEIKKRGRWASDCYRIYIWDGHDRARDVASRMLSSKFSLMASLAAYRRHEKKGSRVPENHEEAWMWRRGREAREAAASSPGAATTCEQVTLETVPVVRLGARTMPTPSRAFLRTQRH